jgi:hypothetical protein
MHTITAVFTGTGPFEDSTGTLPGGQEVDVPPTITAQPLDRAIAPDSPVSFTATASGYPAPTVQWQVSADGGTSYANIPGATSPTYSFTARASDDGNKYRAVFTNRAGSATSNAATLLVNDAPTANNQSVTTNEDTAKAITLTGSDADGDALAYAVVRRPGHGTLSGTAPNLTYRPAANYNGSDSFTFKVNDGRLDSGIATVSITIVPVDDAPRIIAPAPGASRQSVQYSDPIAEVTVSATDIDSLMGQLQATAAGLPAGVRLVAAGDTSSDPRTWRVTGRALAPSGTYTATITVSDGDGKSSSTNVRIVVNKENATLQYTGDRLKSTGSTSGTSKVKLTLSASIAEATDGNIGSQLTGKQIRFEVYNSSGSLVSNCTAPVSTPAPYNGTGSATCQSNVALGAGTYAVKVSLLENRYYGAPVVSAAVTIKTITITRLATGGGWMANKAGQPVALVNSFGFTARALSDGTFQGNSLYIYQRTLNLDTLAGDGPNDTRTYSWMLESTSISGLGTSCTTTAPRICKATFTGKGAISAVDQTTGKVYDLPGGYTFRVDVTDNGSSTRPDTYAIRVWDAAGGTYYQWGSPTWQVPINGGDIQVRP